MNYIGRGSLAAKIVHPVFGLSLRNGRYVFNGCTERFSLRFLANIDNPLQTSLANPERESVATRDTASTKNALRRICVVSRSQTLCETLASRNYSLCYPSNLSAYFLLKSSFLITLYTYFKLQLLDQLCDLPCTCTVIALMGLIIPN